MAKNADTLNKGNIYITRTSPPSVYEAYFKQFERDFKYFLKSRFEELGSNGMMVLTFIGRETTNDIISVQGYLAWYSARWSKRYIRFDKELNTSK